VINFPPIVQKEIGEISYRAGNTTYTCIQADIIQLLDKKTRAKAVRKKLDKELLTSLINPSAEKNTFLLDNILLSDENGRAFLLQEPCILIRESIYKPN
jgi:hypothetical protein